MALAQAPIHQPEVQPEAQLQYPRLQPGVMGMYIFLASEVMFFGSLFAMYFYLIGSHPVGWPPPGTKFVDVWPLPTVNTAVLLSSGVTCHFGLEALRHGRPLGRTGVVAAGIMVIFIVWEIVMAIVAAGSGGYFEVGLALVGAVVLVVACAAALGLGPFKTGRATFYGLWVATIVLGVGFEVGQGFEFLTAHINFTTNIFTSAFFTMTGFHGGHVAGGLILLTLILGRALKGQFSPQHHVGPAAITLYWHFVDVVWLFLYGILYFAVTLSR
jgi:cytochrome c oxidase subunit 3